MKYKIIIFDIGKTLFDKKYDNITPKSIINVIENLRKQGIKIGVCTMRTIKHCLEVVPTQLDFYICLNGSYIMCDEKVIYKDEILMTMKKSEFLTYGVDTSYYSNHKAQCLAVENGFLCNKKGIASEIYNIVLFNVNGNELHKYKEYHYEYWPTTKVLALQGKNSSKEKGIRRVLDNYGFSEPILYFGDGPNDLDIFKNFKDCICMQDCYPELEKYATFKTGSCREEGILTALKKLKIIP